MCHAFRLWVVIQVCTPSLDFRMKKKKSEFSSKPVYALHKYNSIDGHIYNTHPARRISAQSQLTVDVSATNAAQPAHQTAAPSHTNTHRCSSQQASNTAVKRDVRERAAAELPSLSCRGSVLRPAPALRCRPRAQ